MQTTSDSTLAFIFEESAPNDGLSDPFAEAEECSPSPTAAIPEGRVASEEESDATYTFRWDIEVPLAERGKCGAKFMKQWKRVLQAQKLSPLVSTKLLPYEARFQLCIQNHWEARLVAEREAEITEQLMHLRRDALPVAGQPAGTHPAGWQGVRVWMTFARRDVEAALAKKSKV